MIIQNRQRNMTGFHNKTVSFSDKKVKMNFDINILNMMAVLCLSNNSNVKNKLLINLRNLIYTLDESIYENDVEKLKVLNFIKKALVIRLEQRITNRNMILSYIKGGAIYGDIDDEYGELSNKEIEFISETISGALKSAFIEEDIDSLIEFTTRYKATEFRDRGLLRDEFETLIKGIHNKFRKASYDKDTNNVFSLNKVDMLNTMGDVYDQLTASNRGVRTAMQGFNMLIGGMFEEGRFYLLCGNAGCGKSMVLLNLALQIKKANPKYQPKDPTKIPTILYLTQENNMVETVSRLYSMITEQRISNISKEEMFRAIEEYGEFSITDHENICIHIIFKPNRSIDTTDLYTIVEDLEDDGYEVICLLQDHIKRIRATTGQKDQRLELGDTVNEMKVFGELKKMPVISIAHLNRGAADIIEESIRNNKRDAIKNVGRGNIGESLLMVDNSDWVGYLNDEYDSDGNKYMGFRVMKMRYDELLINTLFIPFHYNNKIRLMTDLWDLVPNYKDTLMDQKPQMNNQPAIMKPSMYNKVTEVEEEEEIFKPSVDVYSGHTIQIKFPVDEILYEEQEEEENNMQELFRRAI